MIYDKIIYYSTSYNCNIGFYIQDESFDDKERALVDVMMGEPTITDCSVDCGEGFKTKYTVICKGAEKKVERSGKETLNYRIQDSLDCRTETTKTACVGNAGECKGISTLLGLDKFFR